MWKRKTTRNIPEALRKPVAEKLPAMLAGVLQSLDAIAGAIDDATDMKALAWRQRAACAALKHVDMILKLGEATAPPEDDERMRAAWAALAREQMAEYKDDDLSDIGYEYRPDDYDDDRDDPDRPEPKPYHEWDPDTWPPEERADNGGAAGNDAP